MFLLLLLALLYFLFTAPGPTLLALFALAVVVGVLELLDLVDDFLERI